MVIERKNARNVLKNISRRNRTTTKLHFVPWMKRNQLDYENIWIADSGATEHMSPYIEWFTDYKKCDTQRFVQVANNDRLMIRGTGTILIETKVNGE